MLGLGLPKICQWCHDKGSIKPGHDVSIWDATLYKRDFAIEKQSSL